jgi:hypothetical protein
MLGMRLLTATGVIGVSLLAASTAMADVPWSNPTGTESDFSWSAGATQDGYYGSPVYDNHTFTFTPAAFAASDLNTVNLQEPTDFLINDTFRVDIDIQSGFTLYGVSVEQVGNYSVSGGATANVLAQLSIGDHDHINSILKDMPTIPAFPISDAAGGWSGSVDASGAWHSVHIAMSTALEINDSAPLREFAFGATQGDESLITINRANLTSATLHLDIRPDKTPVIPLPSALFMFPLGAAVAFWCSRSVRRQLASESARRSFVSPHARTRVRAFFIDRKGTRIPPVRTPSVMLLHD